MGAEDSILRLEAVLALEALVALQRPSVQLCIQVNFSGDERGFHVHQSLLQFLVFSLMVLEILHCSGSTLDQQAKVGESVSLSLVLVISLVCHLDFSA